MAKLSLNDIIDLRAYEREREEFRARVIAEKRLRRVSVGPIITFVFENALTMRFQIQEMARAEKMLSDAAIQTELNAYNPLIPEPGELSMTMFIELTSETELRTWLPRLVGVERSVAIAVGSGELIRARLDAGHESQLTREETTASVHYLRVTLDDEARRRFADEPVSLVIDHPEYSFTTELSAETKALLAADWE